MNAADLARLELAKRAYEATQPSDTEVQIGVRRARLSQTRPKRRRTWFSKGLVFVVLAVGSLAYAKPQALGQLVERVLPRSVSTSAGRDVLGSAALSTPPTAAAFPDHTRNSGPAPGLATATNIEAPDVEAALGAESTASAPPASQLELRTTAAKPTKPGSRTATASVTLPATDRALAKPAQAVSDWGRVGHALADGNQAEALSALNELSQSDDPRTRDKADLGRAQLLMAREREQACVLARSLTQRSAGGRIERQAQALLKSCGR